MSKILKTTAIAAGIVPVIAAPGVAHAATSPPAPGHRPNVVCTSGNTFNNVHSGKRLEVYDSYLYNGGKVDQWQDDGTRTQEWFMCPEGSEGFEFVNENSGLCLEIYHSETYNGATVDQWSCNGTATQRWHTRPGITKDSITIVNDHSGLCLEVYHSETNNGAKVDAWGCNRTATQSWLG